MKLKAMFKTLLRAAPAILANTPAIAAAVRDVRKAASAPAPGASTDDSGARLRASPPHPTSRS